ncbi:hypothetical protein YASMINEVIRUS_45 [Yasminevirus sp. GU-2018]|uniref:Uncharacterized protein n=1 Tax=Yasminevirus sp. GU-2018 TaxID=2420051 RepID=A0A5K0U875_9VIRU|nr:hypothetical protein YASMINEVIRUS_45 [Yasminevirus sp. GU-2018]
MGILLIQEHQQTLACSNGKNSSEFISYQSFPNGKVLYLDDKLNMVIYRKPSEVRCQKSVLRCEP